MSFFLTPFLSARRSEVEKFLTHLTIMRIEEQKKLRLTPKRLTLCLAGSERDYVLRVAATW